MRWSARRLGRRPSPPLLVPLANSPCCLLSRTSTTVDGVPTAQALELHLTGSTEHSRAAAALDQLTQHRRHEDPTRSSLRGLECRVRASGGHSGESLLQTRRSPRRHDSCASLITSCASQQLQASDRVYVLARFALTGARGSGFVRGPENGVYRRSGRVGLLCTPEPHAHPTAALPAEAPPEGPPQVPAGVTEPSPRALRTAASYRPRLC